MVSILLLKEKLLAVGLFFANRLLHIVRGELFSRCVYFEGLAGLAHYDDYGFHWQTARFMALKLADGDWDVSR